MLALFHIAFRGACPRDRRLEAIIRKSSDYLLKFSDLFLLKGIDAILAKAIAHTAGDAACADTRCANVSWANIRCANDAEAAGRSASRGKDHDDVR